MHLLLFLALSSGPVPTGGDGVVLTTHFAKVTVLGSWKPDAAQLAKEGQGAPAGVCTALLVEPLPRVGGGYLGGEPKDVTLAGKSYQARTRAALGRTFPPRTVTGPVASFELLKRKPSYVTESPRGLLPVVVVSTCLWGAPLPTSGEGMIPFEVGYYGTVEPVNVTFDLARLDSSPAVRRAPPPVRSPDAGTTGWGVGG
jgi:hypothetical protein